MKKKGFTLLELIVVLFIMSIIIGIASIRFNVIDKIKANMELQTLINDVDYAKMKAIATGQTTYIKFGKDSYIVKIHDTFIEDKIFRQLDYINFLHFSTSNDGNLIEFNSNGSVTYPGTVSINVSDKAGNTKNYELVVIVGGGHARIREEQKRIHTY